MTHDWILDVLEDLGTYARKQDLRELADQLEEARRIATADIALGSRKARLPGNERGMPDTAGHAGEARSAM